MDRFDEVTCPYCDSDNTYYSTVEQTYICDDCGEYFDDSDDER
jgi:transposase-like protein